MIGHVLNIVYHYIILYNLSWHDIKYYLLLLVMVTCHTLKKVVVIRLITIRFKFNSNVCVANSWLLLAVCVLVCLVMVKLWYFFYFETLGTI